MSTAGEAADHWETLAAAQDVLTAENKVRGLYTGVSETKARMYRRTAKALRLEAESGRAHCHACFGPHPPHECPQRPGASRRAP